MNIVQNINSKKVIFLMGPTASGKTLLAISLCKLLPVEIINVDSALIYRSMNIGTAKPSLEDLRLAPHRLLDIRDPSETYSVAEFREQALKEIQDIIQNGNIPLLVGGSMLYFKILLEGLSPLPNANVALRSHIQEIRKKKEPYFFHKQLLKIDPISANRIHPNDFQRTIRALEIFLLSGKTLTELVNNKKQVLPYDIYQFALIPSCREFLYERIKSRYQNMLSNGFEEEVYSLFIRGDLHSNLPSMRCIGYRQMWDYLSGNINYHEMISRAIFATRKVAKHQLTWLRNWENINIINSDNLDLARNTILKIVNIKY